MSETPRRVFELLLFCALVVAAIAAAAYFGVATP